MPTYIALIDFTENGIKHIADSPARADAFIARAEQAGAKVKDLYWTSGVHDGVLVLEAPDDATASAVFLSLARAGNVRTQTMRAYGKDEMQDIVSRLT